MIIASTKQYLEDSCSMKLEVEELEDLLGPDDINVDSRRILEEARDEKGCAIFETLSTDGPSNFVVVSRSRWDKHQRKCGDKIRLPLQVMDGGKRAWNIEELDGARWKKGLWRQRKITWRIVRQHESGH